MFSDGLRWPLWEGCSMPPKGPWLTGWELFPQSLLSSETVHYQHITSSKTLVSHPQHFTFTLEAKNHIFRVNVRITSAFLRYVSKCLDVAFMKQSAFQDSLGVWIPLECLLPLQESADVCQQQNQSCLHLTEDWRECWGARLSGLAPGWQEFRRFHRGHRLLSLIVPF